MTSLHPARRAAERFDALVEAPGTGAPSDRRTAEMLQLVGALRGVPGPAPRQEFVADLRTRLMLAAEAEWATLPRDGAPTPVVDRMTVRPNPVRHERRLRLALTAFAVVGATTATAVASQGALPGDVLYPVKRAIENTQAGISPGEDEKGLTILASANSRLGEIDALTSGDTPPDAALVTATLDDFTKQANEASDHLLSDYRKNGDEESIVQLHDFTADSMRALADLEAVVPVEATPSLVDAAATLQMIDEAAATLCPACGGEGLTEIPAPLAGGTGTGTQVSVISGSGIDPVGPTGAQLPGSTVAGPNPVVIPTVLLTAPTQGPNVPPNVEPTSGPTEEVSLPTTESPGGGTTEEPTTDPTEDGGGAASETSDPTDPAEPTEVGSDSTESSVSDPTEAASAIVDGVTDVLGGITGEDSDAPTP